MQKIKTPTHELLEKYRAFSWRKAMLADVEADPCEIAVCDEFLHPLDETLEILKMQKNKKSQRMYWIIFFTFMSSKRLFGVPEILDEISSAYMPIPRSTYFRLKTQALEEIGRIMENENASK